MFQTLPDMIFQGHPWFSEKQVQKSTYTEYTETTFTYIKVSNTSLHLAGQSMMIWSHTLTYTEVFSQSSCSKKWGPYKMKRRRPPGAAFSICKRSMSLILVHSQVIKLHVLKWKWKWSRSIVSDSLQTHGLYSPWNSPGQNTGMGSLFLLQGIFPT